MASFLSRPSSTSRMFSEVFHALAIHVTLPAVLSLFSSVTTYLAVTWLGLVLPEVYRFIVFYGR